MPKYNKSHFTYEQQLQKLKSRGLIVHNEDDALFYLQHLNYYRLRAYWMHFEDNLKTHQFKAGTTFDDILELYIFDRKLRLLVFEAIEKFEVSVRANWAYSWGEHGGSHAHLDKKNAFSEMHWESNKLALEEELKRADTEDFVQHFKKKYTDKMPPLWAVCEVMSMKSLSLWYKNIKFRKVKKRIANPYDIGENVLDSWLHHLTMIRNYCAHHGRLWNRRIVVKPKQTDSRPLELQGQFQKDSHKLYNSIIILIHLMNKVTPHNHWRQNMKTLLQSHPQFLDKMHFPNDWDKRSIWN